MTRANGFTLIEMIVVLGIMAMLTALALPALQKMYDAMERSIARKEMIQTLSTIAISVRRGGVGVLLEKFPAASDTLPDDVRNKLHEQRVSLAAPLPILITASGMCPVGGEIIAIKDNVSFRLDMRSPDCRVQ